MIPIGMSVNKFDHGALSSAIYNFANAQWYFLRREKHAEKKKKAKWGK